MNIGEKKSNKKFSKPNQQYIKMIIHCDKCGLPWECKAELQTNHHNLSYQKTKMKKPYDIISMETGKSFDKI